VRARRIVVGAMTATRLVPLFSLLLLLACPGPDAPHPPEVPSACGDGVLDEGEFCDDGNDLDGDDCAADCTPTEPYRDFDAIIEGLMEQFEIPGGSVAVIRDGRLVLVRGYGLADVEGDVRVRSDDLFRIASVSKPLTALTVLRLVEQGLLDLDEAAFALVDDLEPLAGVEPDPRLADVTIRHLLNHSGGWDSGASFDPMFRSTQIASVMDAEAPADAETVVRYMMGVPLDFDPGARYAYSNFGYCLLGRIIERVAGDTYERTVRRETLDPMGVARPMIGHSLLEDRHPGEVTYYNSAGTGDVPSVFPDVPGPVPAPYGGFHLEAMDSHGGWISSSVDLARILASVDGLEQPPDLLTPGSMEQMFGRPDVSTWDGADAWYGFGWMVRPTTWGDNVWHGGSLPGTTTLVVRTGDGYGWAAVFNARDAQLGFRAAIDGGLWDAMDTVQEWPDYDLFDFWL
jgi:cysteine-rich repeat protein